MKVAFALLLLWLSQMIAPAQSSLDRLERVELFGHTYVRLGDWARTYHFEITWPPQSKDVYLTNRLNNLVLTIDSRKAELNHVTVWLSVPIAQHNGMLYLSPLDLKSMIHPVFYPPKTVAGVKIKTICLDPGHGGKDPGNRVGPYQEKKYTLLLAQEVRQQLTRAGLNVALTRSTDTFVDLPTRPEIAKHRNADLFVSLHFNSAPPIRTPVSGVEIYCLTPPGALSTNLKGDTPNSTVFSGNKANAQNVLLAYEIQKAIVHRLPVEDRGVRRARLAVLRTACGRTIVTEGRSPLGRFGARGGSDGDHGAGSG